MAFSSKSKVMAVKKETTEGVVVDPVASDFMVVREGSALVGAVETTTSDELRNSIGQSKAFVTKEAPTGTINRYLKTSGVEGQAPEDAPLYEAALGAVEVHATEVSTTTGSTAGDATTRAVLKVADGDITVGELKVGQCVLGKDGTNGYFVRPIYALDEGASPDDVTLGFNLGTAPGAGVGLGKAVFWNTVDEAHPTLSAHEYQSSSANSAYHLAQGGVRTNSITLDYPANDLATATFELGGINFSENPVRIDATNNIIDFTDDGGTVQAVIDSDYYQTPIHLANAIAAKMTAASVGSGDDVITCTFDEATGKYTIASDGTTLSLLFLTGAGNANTIATTIGYTKADKTLATSYEAENALTYGPDVTPSYDDSDPLVNKDTMLLLGDFDDYICFGNQAFQVQINTPKTDVPDACETSGVSESAILSRDTQISGTLKFKKNDATRTYKMLKNETLSALYVIGEKSGGNWVPGTVTATWIPEISITTKNIVDNDGYIVEEFAGGAIVGTSGLQDVYVTQL
jgi:hypothetical protein